MNQLPMFLEFLTFMIAGIAIYYGIKWLFWNAILPAIIFLCVMEIGVGIATGLTGFFEREELAYLKYVEKNYKLFKYKKQLGQIPKSERFVWNDNIEEERIGESFRFVFGGME